MKMKKLLKKILTVSVAGILVLMTAPVIADGIQAALNSVNVNLNGGVAAKSGENYTLQNGTSVPYSILYEGTTYLPVRKLSELLGIEIGWDNDTRTVLINDKFDSWAGAPDFGEVYSIKEIDTTTTVHSVTHWYNAEDITETDKYVEKLENTGFTKVEEGTVKPRFKVYKKGSTEVWLDLGMYSKLVYGITVADTTRPVSGRGYDYLGSKENIPDFSDAYGFIATLKNGDYYYDGYWHLWAHIPDYLTLLEDEGFSVSSVKSGFYGKYFTLKKDKTTITLKFDSSGNSTIPAFVVGY